MANDYALYLDDIRDPPHTGDHWLLCRTVATMLDTLNENGIPKRASFDYELGRTDPGNTGADAVSAFLDYLVLNPLEAAEHVELEVRLHTSSRYGEKRMAELLKQGAAACKAAGIRLVHKY